MTGPVKNVGEPYISQDSNPTSTQGRYCNGKAAAVIFGAVLATIGVICLTAFISKNAADAMHLANFTKEPLFIAIASGTFTLGFVLTSIFGLIWLNDAIEGHKQKPAKV